MRSTESFTETDSAALGSREPDEQPPPTLNRQHKTHGKITFVFIIAAKVAKRLHSTRSKEKNFKLYALKRKKT
jgi:hypothetical protein